MGHCHGDIASSPRLAAFTYRYGISTGTSDSTVLNTHWDPAAEFNVPCHLQAATFYYLMQENIADVCLPSAATVAVAAG